MKINEPIELTPTRTDSLGIRYYEVREELTQQRLRWESLKQRLDDLPTPDSPETLGFARGFAEALEMVEDIMEELEGRRK